MMLPGADGGTNTDCPRALGYRDRHEVPDARPVAKFHMHVAPGTRASRMAAAIR
jgi:hypothetical protein